jgi:hypothetical protein
MAGPPPGLSRWKSVKQNEVDQLATFLSAEPMTTLRATRRTAYIQQLQRNVEALQQRVEARNHWASAVSDHLTAVRALLEQGAAEATSAASEPSAARSKSSRKSGGLG